VIGSTQVPRTLNGAIQSGIATAVPSTQLFASPLRFDEKWQPHPYLATSWDLAPDGKSLTLHLRHDAYFHDGTPVTSADVAFSIMTIKKYHPFKTMFGVVERVDTPDPYTAVIRMSAPHPAILLSMSPALCPIMPEHIYGKVDNIETTPRNTTDVVGSGPFQLVSYKPGQYIILKRFDKYFLPGRPYLDRVVIEINPNPTNLVIEIERGKIQMLPFETLPRDLQRLSKDPHLAITSKGYEGIGPIDWLAFNTARKPLDDVRVRQAIAYSIDKHFISKVLLAGFAQVDDGPIVPTSPLATEDLHRYPPDLPKSKMLLDEAGYKPGSDGVRFKLTIDYIPGAPDLQRNIAEYVAAQLKKVGIDVTVRASPDFPTWAKRIASHDFDLTMDIVFNWGDPVIGVARTYLSSNIRDVIWTNTQSYRNPEVDKLLEEAGTEINVEKRKALYAKFQQIVTEQLPIDYIAIVPYHTVYSKQVGNVPINIWGVMSPLDEVYLK
jgi:peptide/nickel transport system substrate-binding protein